MAQQNFRVNRDIRASQIRVIDPEGNQLGILTPQQGLKEAEARNLDLVEVSPQAKPPVCKIIDYGKFIYEQQKKEKLAKKKAATTVLKEIRLHPNTDTHDVNFKVKHAEKFLGDGNKVKVSVIFKGRELAYKEQGSELLNEFTGRLEDIAKVEQEIKFEGRTMFTILAPQKGKSKK